MVFNATTARPASRSAGTSPRPRSGASGEEAPDNPALVFRARRGEEIRQETTGYFLGGPFDESPNVSLRSTYWGSKKLLSGCIQNRLVSFLYGWMHVYIDSDDNASHTSSCVLKDGGDASGLTSKTALHQRPEEIRDDAMCADYKGM